VTPGPVFLDSGIFIAFLDRSDRHHASAARLFADPPRRWYTSLAVVSETYGWFLHRLGEEAARIFRLALAELPRLQLLPLTQDHQATPRPLLGATAGRQVVDRRRRLVAAEHAASVGPAHRPRQSPGGPDGR